MKTKSSRTLSSTSGRSSAPHARSSAALPVLGGALLCAGLLASCGGGSPATVQAQNQGLVLEQPDAGLGSEFFIGQAHRGGDASNLELTGVFWGRLANIADETGDVQLRDFVISPSIRDQTVFLPSTGDPITYSLVRNSVTDDFRITIDAPAGSDRFNEALVNLEADLTPIFDKSLDPSEVGPFSMVPRNAAIVLMFQDLLEPFYVNGQWNDAHAGGVVAAATGQLNSSLAKVRTGYPPASPYEARVFVDPNHGDVVDRNNDGTAEFYSTRVIVATTISAFDSQLSDPPLATNSTGLPPSIVVDDTNLALRIATNLAPSVGQTQILRNASGRSLAFTGNGSTDSSAGTNDVVRAMRSGGTVTNDADNGFLRDEDRPRILGDLTVLISSAPVVDDPQRPERFRIPQFAFEIPTCSTTPKVGDVLIQSQGVSALVVDPGETSGPTVTDMVVDVIVPVGGVLIAGPSQLQTPFVPGVDNPPCFVRFSPTAATPPSDDVDADAQVVVRFSEPMDPQTLRSFDGFTVTRVANDPTAFDYAIGRVVASPDLRSYSWTHGPVPFSHIQGQSETYFVTLAAGADGPADLAGNELLFQLPQTSFSLEPDQQTGENAGFALRFDEADELFDDGFGELRNGQILYDIDNERILSRPITRFDVAADRNQPLPAVMVPFAPGVQTPLSNLGSKLQTVWRYADLGFSHNDESGMNIDVEGLSWAPIGGNVVSDAYDDFSIRLAHSVWLPDEWLDPMMGTPAYPATGVKINYGNNYLDPINDPGTIVHPRDFGYVVNPSNLYQASSGTSMLPYPLNEGIAVEDYRYYTWRDTAITALGGENGVGVPLAQEGQLLGLNPGGTWGPGQVPTAGLPLLMEFRCYPSEDALGLNAFDISLAANSSARPNFRAFSTGGFDGQQLQTVNPDNQTTATGGFNPSTGGATPGTDNSFYIGEASLVTRVSRTHTIWFDTGFNSPTYAQPIVEPAPADEPAGTSIKIAYRGAVNIVGAGSDGVLNDAQALDVYGNATQGNGTVTFLNGDTSWRNDITQVNSARFFQARVTFISNTATELTPELRSLAFAYFNG